MKQNFTYFIVAIVIAFGVCFGTYQVLDYINNSNSQNNSDSKVQNTNSSEKENTQDNSNSNNTEKITLSDKDLDKYLNYIPFLNASLVENPGYDDAYDGNKNTVESINREILLYAALYSTEEYIFTEQERRPLFNNVDVCNYEPCELDEYYKESSINESLLKMYNINSVNITELPVPGGGVFYQSPYYATYYGAGSSGYYKINKDNKATINGDNIIIEENALFLKSSNHDEDSIIKEGKTQLKVFANTSDMKNNKNVLNIDRIYIDYNKDIESINLDDYGSFKYTKFRHTFKKNNTGYYWYSTEIIEK